MYIAIAKDDFIGAQEALHDVPERLHLTEESDHMLRAIHGQFITLSTIVSHEVAITELRDALRIGCFETDKDLPQNAALLLQEAQNKCVGTLMRSGNALILMNSLDIVLSCRGMILSSNWEVSSRLSYLLYLSMLAIYLLLTYLPMLPFIQPCLYYCTHIFYLGSHKMCHYMYL